MSGQATVEVEGIRKSFSGVEVLHGVDLTADAGSVLALLGENGAGKSTLMKILVGDYPPDAGRVTFAGEDITGATPARPRRRDLDGLPGAQRRPAAHCRREICLGRWPTRRGRVDWRGRAASGRRCSARRGRTSTPTVTVGSLRIGERQVVEIARALPGQRPLPNPRRTDRRPVRGESDRLFETSGACATAATPSSTSPTASTRSRQIADRVQVLRDGETVLEGVVADHGRDANGGGDGRSTGRFDAAARGNILSHPRSTRSSGFGSCRPSVRSPMSISNCAPARSSPSTGRVRGRDAGGRRGDHGVSRY